MALPIPMTLRSATHSNLTWLRAVVSQAKALTTCCLTGMRATANPKGCGLLLTAACLDSCKDPDGRVHACNDASPSLQVMQPALTILANCVTVPPSLAHTSCPAEKPSSRKRQGRTPAQTPGQLPTPGQAPDTAGKAMPELAQASSMEVTYAGRHFYEQSFGGAIG